MKKTLLFTVCLSLFITFSTSAKIWRVNNNPTIPADFTTIQAAHDGAMANDTLHIEPSGVSYGNLTMTKKLIIIGNGYFLDENPNNQVNINHSIVGSVLMRNGSSGSKIMGLEIDYINFQNASLDPNDTSGNTYIANVTDDVTIERNYFKSVLVNINGQVSILFETVFNSGIIGHLSNLIIRNNYIAGKIIETTQGYQENLFQIHNLLIFNNYIQSGGIGLDITSIDCYNSGVISNNVFDYANVRCCGFTVKNNIFANSLSDVVLVGGNYNNTVNNNLSLSPTGLPEGNGNQNGLDGLNIFVGSTGNSTDGQWQLKAGSPAIGAGQNGEDCGMFGGANPYKLSGLPSVPSVYSLSAPANSNGDILPVVISVKSNN